MVIRKVIEVVIISYMSKNPFSAIEETVGEMNIEKYKSDPFSYVMNDILFGNM